MCSNPKPRWCPAIVVPDLEQIARLYLRALDAALEGDGQWPARSRWLILELYDQTVRQESGGDMGRYLRLPDLPNREFVLGRIGAEGRRIMEYPQHQPTGSTAGAGSQTRSRPRSWWRAVRQAVRSPRQWLLQRLLGPDYEALQIGRFRFGRRGSPVDV